MPPSPDRDYFAGVLANRAGRVNESIALLTKALPQIEASSPARAAVGFESLADDYVKAYRYSDALPAYEKLFQKFASQMDPVEKKSVEDDYHAVMLLKDTPPQTVSFDGPIDLPLQRNPKIGTIDSTFTVNGVEQSWILDTGANFSTVSASFAAKLGLKLSKGTAQTQGVTGAENKLHIAIVPEMKLGGATVRNVVLLVLDDENLNLQISKTEKYQIDAVLGYPVMQALKRVTFTKDGHLLAGPDSVPAQNGARLYMDRLTPLLECAVGDRKVLFSFDTGADSSMLTDRYRRDFPSAFQGLLQKPYMMDGAGGMRSVPAYFLPEVELGVGNAHPVLKKVAVVPVLGTDTDRTYGNLGRDLVDAYQSFTIDFENMSFALGDKLANPPN